MHQDINFLILDEPTNHLDIESREVLEEYLKEFTGTVLFVSHDRFFINKMADRILYLEKSGLVNYPGNYDDFKEMRSRAVTRETPGKDDKQKKKTGVNRSQRQKKSLENRKRKIEAAMAESENSIEKIEAEMEKNPADYKKQQDLYRDREDMNRRLDELLGELMEIEGS